MYISLFSSFDFFFQFKVMDVNIFRSSLQRRALINSENSTTNYGNEASHLPPWQRETTDL